MPVSLRTFHSSLPFHPPHALTWQKFQSLIEKYLLAFCEEKCPWVKIYLFEWEHQREFFVFVILVEAFELHIGD